MMRKFRMFVKYWDILKQLVYIAEDLHSQRLRNKGGCAGSLPVYGVRQLLTCRRGGGDGRAVASPSHSTVN